MRTVRLLARFGLLAVAVVVAVGPAASEECSACLESRRTNGWCNSCDIGYVGDVPVHSKHLWHILDAHGHELNVENLRCQGCTAAAATDGFCADSKIGFVDGQGYFSRLTWLLAKSDRQGLERIACATCRRNFATSGWCDQCNVGRIGPRVVDNQVDFNHLVHDMEILAVANEAADRCKHCAVAIVTDTQCPFCRIRYLDGRPLPQEKGTKNRRNIAP